MGLSQAVRRTSATIVPAVLAGSGGMISRVRTERCRSNARRKTRDKSL